ncbi:MAG: mannose-6-phosphate isomerase [Clostridiales bacterium]|jgi:mannose-6-phosphate isomerase|nr:mannose-6-phosphate isomerase [Clostridiales bacterium]
MELKPLKMLENRVWRIYLGGKLLDEFRGNDGLDGYFPEDWLASVVTATNPPRDGAPEREGQSRVEADGVECCLKDLIDGDPEGFLGAEHVGKFGVNFGVLTKFLDSAERLPIQVHPDKEAARGLFGSDYGKTEAWYILGGREIDGEQPHIFLGFKEDVTKECLRELFDKQDIPGMAALMHKVYVKPGDVFMIEGGTPHAIGPGCFLLEIQEPTDYTISLEKYDMRGKKMPDFMCHMGIGFDNMFDCFHYIKHTEAELLAKFKLVPHERSEADGCKVTSLIDYGRTPCFALNRIDVPHCMTRERTGTPSAYAIIEGGGKIGGTDVKRGDCLFIPAMSADFEIEGKMSLIECLPPR